MGCHIACDEKNVADNHEPGYRTKGKDIPGAVEVIGTGTVIESILQDINVMPITEKIEYAPVF